jgi:hypothetical protein
MNKFIGIASSVLMASSFAFTQAASADSSAATCEFYSHGEKKKDRSGPCSFSQRQGYVDIGLSNGKTFNLTPGNKPDHFKDQEDHKVVREQGNGGSQVYKWDEKKIVVTFNNSATAAPANSDAKIQARIETWGKACKNRVAEQFDAPMSDIQVSVGATLQTSIDAGETTLQDLQEYGLSFNWLVKHGGKEANGYCNTDGQGNITEFKQQ